ncbi:MAG: hypothetical protein Q7R54_00230 [bacterium]|nr:hypothetical protein [bacterium]
MRTLDDIIPPSRRQTPPEAAPPSSPLNPRIRSRFPLGTLAIVVLIVAISVGALLFFSNTEVKVTPLSRTATLTDIPFTASAGTGDLSFEIVTVQKVETRSVNSSGTKAVSSSAQGSLTIYNTQNTVQRLITNTRFQTASGLVFRIHAPVTVPGAKNGTPGSIAVIVYADQPGSQYNVGPTSFTIPGLSGTPQFTAVTAKSVNAIGGGASGNEPIVALETESVTRSALMDTLRQDLVIEFANKIPEGYVLISGASETTFDPLPTAPSATANMADLKEQGTMRGVVFSKTALAKAIASNVFGSEYKDEPVSVGEKGGLTLKPKTTLAGTGDETFAFSLSGSVSIISVVDPVRIKAAVAGKNVTDAYSTLKQYPEVNQAVLILRPFWRTSFPEDPSQVTVTILSASEN